MNDDIVKILKSLEDSDLLTDTVKQKKNKKVDFLVL